jgi:predicted ArsR family transcriptional regulator
VAGELGISRKAAGDALQTLSGAGVLTPYSGAARVGRGRPAQLYVSEELLGLTGSTPLRR